MTLYRSCVVRPSKDGGNCKKLDVNYSINNWKSSNVSNVKLVYKEPTQYNVDSTYNLSEQLKLEIDDSTAKGSMSYSCANSDCTSECIGTWHRNKKGNWVCSKSRAIGPVEMSVSYDIEYPESLKWSSKKDDGSLVENANNTKNNFYEIGYGLPVSFVSPDGIYSSPSGGKGELVVEISKLGTSVNGSLTKGRMDHVIAYQYPTTKTIRYSCSFNIKNQLFGDDCEYDEDGKLKDNSPEYCDPKVDGNPKDNSIKDIDVVFRTIDLVKNNGTNYSENLNSIKTAFPGRAGTARTRGANWNNNLKDDSGNYLTNDSDIVNKIAKILDSSIYTKHASNPMYVIVLNSTSIKEIRSYNKAARSASRDPFTDLKAETSSTGNSSDGYLGYVCRKNGNYTYCASRFLSRLYNLETKTSSSGNKVYTLRGYCMINSDTISRAKKYADAKGCLYSD
jgi:hypothetical protein